MLSFPAAIKVYLCTVPCDMRRSFDGLSMLAEHVIGCNPYQPVVETVLFFALNNGLLEGSWSDPGARRGSREAAYAF